MSTRVMPQVMSVLDRSNVLARSLTVRETVKKSKASHVYAARQRVMRGGEEGAAAAAGGGQRRTQAQKARQKKAQWRRVSMRSCLHGFGTGSSGGRSDERRVAA